jgi:hypothetical protein
MVQSVAMRERAHKSLALGRLDRLAMLALAVTLAWGTTTPARADTEACLEAYDGNQRLRRAGELRAARAQLLVCSQAACPDPIRKECIRWLAEVDAAMPSVVFAAQDAAGHDLGAVRVEVDGVVMLERLDGRAVALDPGERTICWTSANGSTVERRVVIREAQKRRLIEVRFAPKPAAVAAPPTSSTTSTAKEQRSMVERDDHGEIPTEAWVFGGIGAAGLASFGFFGWRAWWETDDLRERCAPNCDSSDVDGAKTKALVADVSLGVALVGAAGAAYFVLRGEDETSAPVDGRVEAVVGPGWLGLQGAF